MFSFLQEVFEVHACFLCVKTPRGGSTSGFYDNMEEAERDSG